jgi:hypothetical protein
VAEVSCPAWKLDHAVAEHLLRAQGLAGGPRAVGVGAGIRLTKVQQQRQKGVLRHGSARAQRGAAFVDVAADQFAQRARGTPIGSLAGQRQPSGSVKGRNMAGRQGRGRKGSPWALPGCAPPHPRRAVVLACRLWGA